MPFHHLILHHLSSLLSAGYLICYFVRDNEDMPLWRGGFYFVFFLFSLESSATFRWIYRQFGVFYITSHYLLCDSQTLENLIPEKPANV